MAVVPLDSLSTSFYSRLPPKMYDFLPLATSQSCLREFEWIYGMECGDFQCNSSMNIVQIAPDIHNLICLNTKGLTIVPSMDTLQELKEIVNHNKRAKEAENRLCVFDRFPCNSLYEYILVPLGRLKTRQPLYAHQPETTLLVDYCNPSQSALVTSRAHPTCVARAAAQMFSIVGAKNLLDHNRELHHACRFLLPVFIRPPAHFCLPESDDDDAFTDDSRDDDRLELGSDRSNPEDNVRLLETIPPVPDLVDSSSSSSSQHTPLSDVHTSYSRKRKSKSSHSSRRSKEKLEMGVEADRKRVELAKRNRRRVISWAKDMQERADKLDDGVDDDMFSQYAVEYSRPPEDVQSKPQLARRQSIS